MEARISLLVVVVVISEKKKLKTSKIGLLLVKRRRQIYRQTGLSGDVASGDNQYEHCSIFDDGIVDRAFTSAFVVIALTEIYTFIKLIAQIYRIFKCFFERRLSETKMRGCREFSFIITLTFGY